MSLTTRCPACATLFRVVPDQLKVSGGWVRCGRCADVFDARLSLSPPLPVVQEVVEPSAPPPHRVTVEVSHEVAIAPSQDPTPSEPQPIALVAPDAQVAPVAAEAFVPASPPPSDGVGPTTGAGTAVATAIDPPAGAAAAPPAEGDTVALAARSPALDQVSFMRAARRRAFWRRPAVRVALALASLSLALALGLQAALYWRNSLALAYPGLQPALQALCIPFECRVGAPRMIESITFEGSSFARLQPDV